MHLPRSEALVIPIRDLFQVSTAEPSGVTVLPAKTRALLVGVAGTLNVRVNDTNYTGVPFVGGITAGFWQQVNDGGTAQNVWAIL